MAVCCAVPFHSTFSVGTRWWLWGRVGSCTEWDLENMMAGGGWNLVLHQKLLHGEGGVSRHIVIMQDTIVSQFYHHFLPSSILPMLQNFGIKIRITILSCRDTLMVLQTQVIYKQWKVWPAEIMLPTVFSFSILCWCAIWKCDILSQDHARARAHTHTHTHTHKLHGVCSVLIPHYILLSFVISSVIEHWSHIMVMESLATCLSFLDIAGVPLRTLSCSDFWPFLHQLYQLCTGEYFKNFITMNFIEV
jgi:hypothetical protein